MRSKSGKGKKKLEICHTFKDPEVNEVTVDQEVRLKDFGLAETPDNPKKKLYFKDIPHILVHRFDSSKSLASVYMENIIF